MRWLPAHEDHAIERVNLSFEFAEPLPAKPFQALINSASLDFPKQGFNSVVDEHEIVASPHMIQGGAGANLGFRIQFAGHAPAQMASPSQMVVGGRNFQALNETGVREEVLIHRDRFVHSSMIYGGWAAHRARVLALLGSYLDRALPLANVHIIKLEYWDRFVFRGAPAEAAYSELLRPNSRFLPGFPTDTRELWHSHVGFFLPDPPRRLINVNVDVIDIIETSLEKQATGESALRRSVGLYTLAQDTLAQGASPSSAEGTISTLEALHTILKETFSAVITDEAANRISLNARKHP
jgi:uncharacterized protein (TIGR04255 family)